MDLSIVIVNWKSTGFVMDSIASIHATLDRFAYEIIVVDNASDDDCKKVIEGKYPAVQVICSNSNVGFAAANNLGFERSSGNSVLFLNPDTVVRTHSIERMFQQLNSGEEIGAVGCRLLNGDSSLQTSCVQPFPTIANQLFGLDCLKKAWPRARCWGTHALFARRQTVAEVEVVSGACLMVKREVFERVGRFSTEYFMYAEEADLCRKILMAGRKVCHVADAVVVHFGGQSSNKHGNAFSDIVMRNSIFHLLRKFRGATYAWTYRVALLVSAACRMTILVCCLAVPIGVALRSRVTSALQKWFHIGKWALGLESWTDDLLRPGFGQAASS